MAVYDLINPFINRAYKAKFNFKPTPDYVKNNHNNKINFYQYNVQITNSQG